MQLTLDWLKSTETPRVDSIFPTETVKVLLELLVMLLLIHTWVWVRNLIILLANKGLEQSRRDDLEAIGYVLIYFLKGSLPWQGLKGDSKKVKYDAIMEKKVTTSTMELCAGLPREFVSYLDYVRNLRFDDTPDYVQLRQMFRDLYIRKGYAYDYLFDWIVVVRSPHNDPKLTDK